MLIKVDRIDGLLFELLAEHGAAVFLEGRDSEDELKEHQGFVEALLRQISTEYNTMVSALKAAQPTLYCMLCERWGHPDGWRKDRHGYEVYHEVLYAIALIKGESVSVEWNLAPAWKIVAKKYRQLLIESFAEFAKENVLLADLLVSVKSNLERLERYDGIAMENKVLKDKIELLEDQLDSVFRHGHSP